MRHRKRGRVLGRSPSHRKALLRNLASALFLTELDKDDFLDEKQAPKVKGRIVTTIQKAKEVRPLVERCISIACRAQAHWTTPRSSAPRLSATAMNGANGARASSGSNGPQPWRRWSRLAAVWLRYWDANARRSCALKWLPRGLSIVRAVIPELCGWPRRDWAMLGYPGDFGICRCS